MELELILTKILELGLELNPKTVAGIGINSIFFGMTKGLDMESACEFVRYFLSASMLLGCVKFHAHPQKTPLTSLSPCNDVNFYQSGSSFLSRRQVPFRRK